LLFVTPCTSKHVKWSSHYRMIPTVFILK
jgi:hypothetical protein